MAKVRLGIIGCGVIGQKHINTAASAAHIDLVAIADLSAELREKIKTEHQIDTAYATAEELIADPRIEAVVLALPTGVRTPLAFDVLKAGKHLLLEKPAAAHTDDLLKMKRLQGQLVIGSCSSRHRFLPAAEVAEKVIASGRLGKILAVKARGLRALPKRPGKTPPAWRLNLAANGGGILANWGVYDLDYILGLTGWSLTPQTCLAKTWSAPDIAQSFLAPNQDAETYANALVLCAGGEILHLERGEYLTCSNEDAWTIQGSDATLQLNLIPPDARVVIDTIDLETGPKSEVLYEGKDDWMTAHRGPVLDFCSAILENRPPKATLDHAIVIQKITDAIYESSRTASCVAISE